MARLHGAGLTHLAWRQRQHRAQTAAACTRLAFPEPASCNLGYRSTSAASAFRSRTQQLRCSAVSAPASAVPGAWGTTAAAQGDGSSPANSQHAQHGKKVCMQVMSGKDIVNTFLLLRAGGQHPHQSFSSDVDCACPPWQWYFIMGIFLR